MGSVHCGMSGDCYVLNTWQNSAVGCCACDIVLLISSTRLLNGLFASNALDYICHLKVLCDKCTVLNLKMTMMCHIRDE